MTAEAKERGRLRLALFLLGVAGWLSLGLAAQLGLISWEFARQAGVVLSLLVFAILIARSLLRRVRS
ncbi:hypothetical protein [Micromonospora viridifaciens]|nr:hypothetical protein [Micromonospora viridifaciens]